MIEYVKMKVNRLHAHHLGKNQLASSDLRVALQVNEPLQRT